MALFVTSTVHKVNFIMIQLNLVLVHHHNFGMVKFVFYVLVVSYGILQLRLAIVQLVIYGMVPVVMIHVMEEEY